MSEPKIVDSLFADWLDKKIPWYERAYYYMLRKYRDVRYFIKRQWQRIRYGFPTYQAWDFYGWHSRIVTPRLKHLRNNLHGHPSDFKSTEEWQVILDKIIWAFENCEQRPDFHYSDDYDHRYMVTETELGKVYTSMNTTGTIDMTPVIEHNERVQEGLDLFAKYYFDLWD